MPPVAMDHLPHYDCGVVLTGSAGRIREGFEVLALKKIDKLIVSGVYKDTKLHQIFPLLPYYPEIQSDDIVLEKISGSTYGNAVQSLQVVETLKCRNILLITSHLHMYRAYKTFRENFPNEIQISPYVITASIHENSYWDVMTEAFKSLCYPVITLIPWLFFS
ncbi:hypothetical protein A11Q_1124 [Pseudobdellovibrio exovorus JSS]|uniref:DUF218 domain-containing protein n=2 Tax=Pseudobdellovibrio exovorus TaxID=453816 RepID=M4VA49_9BACT|nr:hypothetical protein A11Q_1124 [Pseudobdellovibrio exovorus JSS]